MKKSLVALAVLAATGAYAQSSVTLYGIVEGTTDIGYRRIIESTNTVSGFAANGVAITTAPNFTAPTYRNQGNTDSGNVLTFGAVANSGTTTVRSEQKNGFRVQDGSDQGSGTSRIGFRGTEDLGGGLKANFQLEMGLRLDDGCTTLTSTGGCDNGGFSANSGGSTFGRNAWGGISGSFGEFRIGRQVWGSYSTQANSSVSGASLGLYDASTAGNAALAIGGVRASNALRYITPNLGGFTGSIMFAAPETGAPTNVSTSAPSPANSNNLVTTTGASRRTGVDLALEYANGPAYFGLGYNKRDLGNNTSSNTPFAAAGTGNNVASNISIGTVTAYTIGGSFDLGVVKPFLNYTRATTTSSRTDTASTGSSATDTSVATSGDRTDRGYSIGLRAPVGAFTIITGYGRFRTNASGQSFVTQASGSTSYGQRSQFNTNAFQLGAQYALSKRTLVEANYGYNKVSTSTDSTVANSNIATNAGTAGSQNFRQSDRQSAFNVGLKHSF